VRSAIAWGQVAARRAMRHPLWPGAIPANAVERLAMTITMHELAIEPSSTCSPPCPHLLDKAAEHAAARKFEPSALANARLTPDMFPLSTQIYLACHHAKDGPARLLGQERRPSSAASRRASSSSARASRPRSSTCMPSRRTRSTAPSSARSRSRSTRARVRDDRPAVHPRLGAAATSISTSSPPTTSSATQASSSASATTCATSARTCAHRPERQPDRSSAVQPSVNGWSKRRAAQPPTGIVD